MGRPTRPVTRRGFIQGGVGATAALVTGLPVAIQADETAGAAIPGGMGEVPALDEVPLRFRVNDEAIEGQVGPDDSLLKVLRDDLLLTGTKEGCGTGACGACFSAYTPPARSVRIACDTYPVWFPLTIANS